MVPALKVSVWLDEAKVICNRGDAQLRVGGGDLERHSLDGKTAKEKLIF